MRRLAALGLMLLWLVVPGRLFAEPMDGTVSVQVTNRSQGGTSPAGDSISLLIFGIKEQGPVGNRSSTVGADGRAVFSGLDRDPNLAYWVLVEHQGVAYPSTTPFQLKDQQVFAAEVPVYDTIGTDNQLQYDRVNLLIVNVSPGTLTVMQMGGVVNNSDRTYVTPNPQDGSLARAVRFGLPSSALSAQFETGFGNDSAITWPGGLQSTAPLKPGRQEYAVSFVVPYTGTEADLTIQLPYAAGTVNIYAPETGVTVESSVAPASGTGQLGGQTFQLFTATGLTAGSSVPVRVRGLPSAGGDSSGFQQQTLLALSGVVVLLAVGLFVYTARLRSQRPAVAGAALSGADAYEEERLQLVARLASLDERFASGELDEQRYEEQRQRGMQRLVELTRLQRSAEPAG